ncbi:putative nickel-containing superoxide dismutase [Polaribacter irgensii 23-P]|uniref:Putative nickel-containing superoxide dismutase n=1 Tax=Polaribacter irgensii 23-P TaxID=313594 RepID=A4C131_9FLAO|nr:superoxide dismutase, Ni [Polaribacter irgensii]EAR11834.1 putative nickel-containing superoxide dismutase [Polaribacter irgensii 23-P]
MLSNILNLVKKITPVQEVHAHCDIPCGIYDPGHAIIGCLTIIRMTDLMNDHSTVKHSVDCQNEVSRYIAEKERHAAIVKHEIRIIWGDFFKPPQFEKYPELHDLTHRIMLLGSKARQEVNTDAALELLEKVNRFAELFWEIKGITTKKSVYPYPPALAVIYPEL